MNNYPKDATGGSTTESTTVAPGGQDGSQTSGR